VARAVEIIAKRIDHRPRFRTESGIGLRVAQSRAGLRRRDHLQRAGPNRPSRRPAPAGCHHASPASRPRIPSGRARPAPDGPRKATSKRNCFMVIVSTGSLRSIRANAETRSIRSPGSASRARPRRNRSHPGRAPARCWRRFRLAWPRSATIVAASERPKNATSVGTQAASAMAATLAAGSIPRQGNAWPTRSYAAGSRRSMPLPPRNCPCRAPGVRSLVLEKTAACVSQVEETDDKYA